MNEYEIDRGDSFTGEKTRTQTLKHAETSQIKYDLIGKIADGAKLTRKSASAILQGIRADKLYMFKNNPEEFISKVIRLINEQKATMIVEHISYNTIEGEYDSSIFTAEKATQSFDKAFLAKKAIQDYVFTDGSAEKSIERMSTSTRSWRGPPSGPLRCWDKRTSTMCSRLCFPIPAPGSS
ncbi:hypothetical protein [Gemmiger sp.]|uniref:hypothetical protein n=1 Tax=Gemmiger sp. TaxID=2049027 RepID=UPI0039C86BC7